MARRQALELVPDALGRDLVVGDWQALRDAGLPSQLDHPGVTNTPHITVLAAQHISEDDEVRASQLFAQLMPVRGRVAGLALLGGGKVTVVRLVDIPDQVAAAVACLRSEVTGAQHAGWLPHLTLSRRLPRDQVQRAVDVLGHDDAELSFVGLRRWDPAAGTVRTIALGRG